MKAWDAINHMAIRGVRVRRFIERRKLTRELANSAEFSWTADYVSAHVANWTTLFTEYRGKPDVKMLELGSYEGRSAVWFLANILTGPGAALVCVDVFYEPRWELRFEHNIRLSGAAGRVTKIKSQAAAYLPDLPRAGFDIVYVDASHKARDVLMDALLSWRLLKPGGILLFDDYLWEPDLPAIQRPRMAIDLFLDALEGRYDVLLKEYQVAVRRLAA